MQKHIKNFRNHYQIAELEVVMCQHCNKRQAADIHHIIFKSQGGSDEIENLIALCRECHDKAHGKLKKGEKKILAETLLKIINQILYPYGRPDLHQVSRRNAHDGAG